MEQFIIEGTKEFWDCLHIGIARKENGCVKYEEMSETNNQRMDQMGEFLNRPMFIMKSRKEITGNLRGRVDKK